MSDVGFESYVPPLGEDDMAETRHRALELAIDYHRGLGLRDGTLLKTARAFEAYLSGRDIPEDEEQIAARQSFELEKRLKPSGTDYNV